MEVQNTLLREKHGQRARNGEQGLGVRDQESIPQVGGSAHIESVIPTK